MLSHNDEIIELAISMVANKPAFTNQDLIFRSWVEGFSLSHEASTADRPSDIGYFMHRAMIEAYEASEYSQSPAWLNDVPEICRNWVAYQIKYDRSGKDRNIQLWRKWYEGIQKGSLWWLPDNPRMLIPNVETIEDYYNFASFGHIVYDTALNYIAATSMISRFYSRFSNNRFSNHMQNVIWPDLVKKDTLLRNLTPTSRLEHEQDKRYQRRRRVFIASRIHTAISHLANGTLLNRTNIAQIGADFLYHFEMYPECANKRLVIQSVARANRILDDAGILID